MTGSTDWRALAAGTGTAAYGPQRIVCLTEEPTEWLYLLGEERRIVGISGYTVRPPRAREEKPKVSAFLNAKIDKIVDLQPDCVIGFSDLQADIASQLVKKGIQVTIFNQRSVAEIFSMMYQLAAMVGQEAKGLTLIQAMQQRLLAIEQTAARLKRRPRVFFEEWYDPHISAIAWVSELMAIAGGDDCFPELASQAMGKDRIIADGGEIVRRNPDI
ncbi:MAG: ABC transporter substrate-binding protein, partial [Pseudomonadota bacterium]